MFKRYSADWIHKEYPKTCQPHDFWSQVKRTVNGVPVGEDQVALIERAIISGLRLNENDYLVDLCCGNGALSTRIFNRCMGGLGVDFSEYLIDVAKNNFANQRQQYIVRDVVAFCSQTTRAERFTKACCYGAFCYLAPERARQLLFHLRWRFRQLERVFLGNIADRDKLDLFFTEQSCQPGTETDSTTAIGYWWQADELTAMASDCGWDAEVKRMPPEFYAAHYRFDITLIRRTPAAV